MIWLILRYLVAAPFVMLWAVCVVGNVRLLLLGMSPRNRSHAGEPLPLVGTLCGLVAVLLLPAVRPWWELLLLAIVPDLIAVLARLVAKDANSNNSGHVL